MAASRIRSTTVTTGGDCEAWPYLDEGVLRPSRSRKVCMTCHWFRHHAQGRLKVIEWRTRSHASKSEHPFDVVRQFLLTFVH